MDDYNCAGRGQGNAVMFNVQSHSNIECSTKWEKKKNTKLNDFAVTPAVLDLISKIKICGIFFFKNQTVAFIRSR